MISAMRKRRQELLHRPFECLGELLATERLPADAAPTEAVALRQSPVSPGATDEQALFENAMAGVRKISRDNCVRGPLPPTRPTADPPAEETAVIRKLECLVQRGIGFVVADTPEYIEGKGPLAHPEITTWLHRGRFSIQDHLDLHGLRVAEAAKAFDEFLDKSIAEGKRAVLIIHGRGLSSPGEPVLKTRVHQWLTQNRRRKWVIAFTSARSCDGGAGATYVLLRQRPLTKSQHGKRRHFSVDKHEKAV